MKQAIFIYCTVPDKDTAVAIGRKLVENRLAACVSFGSPVQSIYRWQGVLEEAEGACTDHQNGQGKLFQY